MGSPVVKWWQGKAAGVRTEQQDQGDCDENGCDGAYKLVLVTRGNAERRRLD